MEIVAKFIGKTGIGYRTGAHYRISVVGNIVKSKDRPNCPYESVESFLNNWANIVPVDRTK